MDRKLDGRQENRLDAPVQVGDRDTMAYNVTRYNVLPGALCMFDVLFPLRHVTIFDMPARLFTPSL